MSLTYYRKTPLVNVMKRSIEIPIDNNDVEAFLDTAKELAIDAAIIPGQEDLIVVGIKVRYLHPKELLILGMKFQEVMENKDPVF